MSEGGFSFFLFYSDKKNDLYTENDSDHMPTEQLVMLTEHARKITCNLITTINVLFNLHPCVLLYGVVFCISVYFR